MDCRVIKDLIPMYVEKLTSEPSNDLIAEHIKTCEDCSRTLTMLKNNFITGIPENEQNAIDTVPVQLIKRIKNNILEKLIILASIALAVGILIGIMSSSPVMFMAFIASTSIVAFAIAILLGIAVCRKTPSMKKRFQRVANWTFLFSLITSFFFLMLFGGYYKEFALIAVILVLVIIYNIAFSLILRIYARTKLPQCDAVTDESSNRRLYCVAFCTLLALTLLIAVPVTILEKNRTVDNIDLPFVNDPDLIGRWQSVDFVKNPEQFIPGRRALNVPLFLEGMVFLKDGRMMMSLDNREGLHNPDAPRTWLSWTKGVVLHKGGEHTSSKYMLREINGEKYLFFEWKSGDIIYFHLQSHYYVLKKVN